MIFGSNCWEFKGTLLLTVLLISPLMPEVSFFHTAPMQDNSVLYNELLNYQWSGSGLCRMYKQYMCMSLKE